jgi:hypothetical protein
LRIAGALLDPGTRECWLRKLPGFLTPLYAQRKFGAVAKTYDDNCRHDIEVVDRILAVMERDPAERQRLRARVYKEAEEFVRDHWPMIEKLGGEIFRRGRLDKREIEAVLAPLHGPPAKPATRNLSPIETRTVTPRVAASFHEAGHILAAVRQGQTIKSSMIDEHGAGRTRCLEPCAPKGDQDAIRRFCVVALAGGIAVQKLTGRQDDQAQQDMRNVERRIAHLPAAEQAIFLREATAAAKRLVDADWTLLSELARHLYRRGALDHMDVLNVLNLAPSRRAA